MRTVSIQDGDTLTLHGTLPFPARHRIRLAGIDAPEKGEAFHDESRLALQRLTMAHEITIELTDRFDAMPDYLNRLLAYLWAGPVLVNEELVRQGMACVWSPRGPSQHEARLLRAQAEAQEAVRGFWAFHAHRLCDVLHRPR